MAARYVRNPTAAPFACKDSAAASACKSRVRCERSAVHDVADRAEALKHFETKHSFRKLNERIDIYLWMRPRRVVLQSCAGSGFLARSQAAQGAPGQQFNAVRASVAPAIRIQIDTSFVADLIHNIQYDSGDHRAPETIHQTNWQRRLNNRGQVPLNR